MKKITLLFMTAMLSANFACTNNSPDSYTADVEYKVTSSSDMMVDIWYRNESGQMVQLFTPDGSLNWSKRLTVNIPFEANLSAGFYNNGLNTETCSVQILVDDQLIEDYPGSLAASLSYTMMAECHVAK